MEILSILEKRVTYDVYNISRVAKKDNNDESIFDKYGKKERKRVMTKKERFSSHYDLRIKDSSGEVFWISEEAFKRAWSKHKLKELKRNYEGDVDIEYVEEEKVKCTNDESTKSGI